MNDRSRRVIDLLDAVGRETAFKLLVALGMGERRLGDLTLLVASPADAVRGHLDRLRLRRLVACRREEGVELYRLADPVVMDFLRMADRLVRMLQTEGVTPPKEITSSAVVSKSAAGK